VLGDKRYQLDCHLARNRSDRREGHGTRSAFRRDRARDRHLRVAGYSVTRLSWAQLEDEPDAVAADLGHLLVDYKCM
jgi:very-short-patch-repair endonuclease